jgi:Ca2+-transporting ATPase
MRSLQETQNLLPTSLQDGLAEEAVERSRRQFGANRLTPLPRESVWKKFLEKFDEPIIKILLAAALLSMVVDLFKADTFLGSVALGLVGSAVVAAVLLRQVQWIPSLLFGLAAILFFGGAFAQHFLVEGLAVMVAVILATGVAFANEYKSDREFEILNAQKASVRVKVLRGEVFHAVALEDIVVGDLVVLEAGDEVPADGRLVRSTELYVDQSLMTGESEPVRKQVRPADDAAEGPEQPGCLYRGTQVVDGIGQMVVTEVGDATYLGQIARRLSAVEGEDGNEATAPTDDRRVRDKLTISKELTPLQVKLSRLAELISRVGYFAAVLILLAQLLHGVLAGKVFWPTTGPEALDVLGVLLGYVVNMVIIIVVAVPEGLPMSVTVSLALAMQKMTRANALVRQLVACETIGSATVICSDKTGTLTQNRMQVERLSWDGQIFDRSGPGWATPEPRSWVAGAESAPPRSGPPGLRGRSPGQIPGLEETCSCLLSPLDGKPLDWIALNAAVNATAHLEEKDGKVIAVGSSTEGALLKYLREGGLDYTRLRVQFEPLYQIHFSSERKRMATVIRYGGRLVTLVKGAPEWLLEQSTHLQASDGTLKALTDAERARVQDRLHDSALMAMRTLAFGHAVLPESTPDDADGLHGQRESLESGLVFAGFVAIRDPLRPDVPEALAQCRQAGIEVKMITGDNVQTARAIGHAIGLIDRADSPIDTPGAVVLTSNRYNQMTDEEVKEVLPRLRILARARPLDKYRMVKLLQQQNEVVAVTGDGTNDAPALKKADVGLAMGIAGTEVAKEASKIVLLDDSFSTIVKAVQWGRSLYENIQRFIQFQLTINVSALTIYFLGALIFQVEAPFTVLQLLWINVIMDTFASIALCSEPPRPGVMTLPPKRKDENILTRGMVRTIFVTGAFFVVAMLGLLVLMRGSPEQPGLFAGDGAWSAEIAGTRRAVAASEVPAIRQAGGEVSFTVLQVSLFFSVYVFFQVWNQINSRSLRPEVSGFHRLWANPTFLMIAGAVAVGQILIVTFGGVVFKVEPLSMGQWLAVIVGTSSVLVFAEVSRRVRLALLRGTAGGGG